MAPKKIGTGKSGGRDSSILAKISSSEIVSQGRRAACDAVYVSKKLLRSTGTAAWLVGTTFLIIVVPLILEMNRDQQLSEIEFQQGNLFGAPQGGSL